MDSFSYICGYFSPDFKVALMNLDNFKTIVVVGLGRSGASLAEFFCRLGKRVKITEKKNEDSFSSLLKNRLTSSGVELQFGGHSRRFIEDADLMVVSPGVDLATSEAVKYARELGVLTVGEIEVASWVTPAKIVAITGTNGKTTTSFLTYRVLKENNKNVYLAGNIGIPFSRYALTLKKNDIVVLEVSSFQLETIIEFRPYVACLLNIEPDHLDRYSDFSHYCESKMNIFRNQRECDWAVLNKNFLLRGDVERKIKAKKVYFSSELGNENYSAVYRIASIFRISKLDCFKVLSQFKGLPHRMQFVRRIRGVTFINDSKSTNPASTRWALQRTSSPVILIAGGKDKGVDFRGILPYLRRVKKVYLIGEAAKRIRECICSSVSVDISPELNDAVWKSFSDAESGDTVLFSPMCSSFDMFSSYVERGNEFMRIVHTLDGELK